MKAATPREIFSIDLRSLGLFRIGLAGVLLLDLLIRLRDLKAFYTDEGVLPVKVLQNLPGEDYHWTLHALSGSALFQGILFGIAILAALALILGIRWRIAAIISWILLISLQSRNPIVLDGSDMMLRVMLFWAIFLPLGKRFSLEAMLDTGFAKLPKSAFSGATVAILIQWICIYFFSGLLKSGPEWHEEGTAMQLALKLDLYLDGPGKMMAGASPGFLKFLTHLVWYFEVVFPFFILIPFRNPFWRILVAVGYIGFHLSIESLFSLGNYPKLGIVTVLPLIPGMVWDRIGGMAWINKVEAWANRFWQKPVSLLQKGKLILPTDRSSVQAPVWLNFIASLMLIYVVLWNIGTLPNSNVGVKGAYPLGRILRLDQAWIMFAPFPDRDDGWFVLPAKLSDGREVDLFPFAMGADELAPPQPDKPEYISRLYPNARWQGYMGRLWLKADQHHRPHFLEWLCQKWNQAHPQGPKTLEIVMVYMLEKSETDQPESIVPNQIYDYHCVSHKMR